MSKLSFRARQLDASKSMPVYLVDEIPDMPDFTAINRAVPQMPTGMEKEEETEHHLQRALSAQQVYGTSEALVIPVPEIEGNACGCPVYAGKWREYKPPKQYIHVQPFGLDQEIPDYDMDSEDETWLNKQAKNLKMDVSPLKFENMMDRLEKGSGQTVVSLQDAKALIKEDDDLIIAVYDYWLNKRLRLQHALIPSVKTEKRDGSTTNNPYVAFRRRTEKMQTRKNRKNDEASYEKMLKLRRDLNRALTILEMIKRREKSKKELLQLTIEVVEKRYEMQDWEGKSLAEALAQRHKVQPFVPMPSQYIPREWGHKPKLFGSTQDDGGFVRKKREYKKRKHKQPQGASSSLLSSLPHLPQYGDVEAQQTTNAEAFSSEDDALSPLLSASDHELDDDPDGVFAFRRKEGCLYHAPILDGQGSWPWCSREEGGLADPRYRYSHSMLSRPRRRYIGPARRRVGRGGRVLFDRVCSSWEDEDSDSDVEMHPQQNNLKYFRPCSPLVEDDAMTTPFTTPHSPPRLHPTPSSTEFSAESFLSHQQQLLQRQHQQQEEILKRETDQLPPHVDPVELDSSLTSSTTSRFTLDSASAQFAASAVCSSSKDYVAVSRDSPLLVQTSLLVDSLSDTVTLPSPQVNLAVNSELMETLNNGPIPDNKSCGLSTSPAANVLQLNFPLTPSSLDTPSTPVVTSSITNCSLQSISSLAKSTTNAGIITKVVSSSPTILKIGTSLVNKNNTISVNHEPVNSIVQEQAVPMEVT